VKERDGAVTDFPSLAASPAPFSVEALLEVLHMDGWNEVREPLIVVPRWAPPEFLVVEGTRV